MAAAPGHRVRVLVEWYDSTMTASAAEALRE